MNRSRGFTLIELMVTLAVAAILISLAFPAFDEFVRSNRRAAAVNEFMATANLARSEATRRSSRVTICRSINPTAATPACDSAGDPGGWEHGWFIFSDFNNDNIFDPDGDDAADPADDEALIKVNQNLANTFRLRATGNLEVRLSFSPSGATAGDTSGTLSFCDTTDNGNRARDLLISNVGRTRTVETTYASCPPP